MGEVESSSPSDPGTKVSRSCEFGITLMQEELCPSTLGKWHTRKLVRSNNLIKFNQQIFIQSVERCILEFMHRAWRYGVQELADIADIDEAANDGLADLRQAIKHELVGSTHDIHDRVNEVVDANANNIIEQLSSSICIQMPQHQLKRLRIDMGQVHINVFGLSPSKPPASGTSHEETLKERTAGADERAMNANFIVFQLHDDVPVVEECRIGEGHFEIQVKAGQWRNHLSYCWLELAKLKLRSDFHELSPDLTIAVCHLWCHAQHKINQGQDVHALESNDGATILIKLRDSEVWYGECAGLTKVSEPTTKRPTSSCKHEAMDWCQTSGDRLFECMELVCFGRPLPKSVSCFIVVTSVSLPDQVLQRAEREGTSQSLLTAAYAPLSACILQRLLQWQSMIAPSVSTSTSRAAMLFFFGDHIRCGGVIALRIFDGLVKISPRLDRAQTVSPPLVSFTMRFGALSDLGIAIIGKDPDLMIFQGRKKRCSNLSWRILHLQGTSVRIHDTELALILAKSVKRDAEKLSRYHTHGLLISGCLWQAVSELTICIASPAGDCSNAFATQSSAFNAGEVESSLLIPSTKTPALPMSTHVQIGFRVEACCAPSMADRQSNLLPALVASGCKWEAADEMLRPSQIDAFCVLAIILVSKTKRNVLVTAESVELITVNIEVGDATIFVAFIPVAHHQRPVLIAALRARPRSAFHLRAQRSILDSRFIALKHETSNADVSKIEGAMQCGPSVLGVLNIQINQRMIDQRDCKICSALSCRRDRMVQQSKASRISPVDIRLCQIRPCPSTVRSCRSTLTLLGRKQRRASKATWTARYRTGMAATSSHIRSRPVHRGRQVLPKGIDVILIEGLPQIAAHMTKKGGGTPRSNPLVLRQVRLAVTSGARGRKGRALLRSKRRKKQLFATFAMRLGSAGRNRVAF
ncbi:hypothetical protein KC340_g159 [Hortaea werneckii]|nr:hypothetical protein KC340_g159 [Hortaea werneckii]